MKLKFYTPLFDTAREGVARQILPLNPPIRTRITVDIVPAGTQILNAKAQRREDAKWCFLLCVFATWRLCVKAYFLSVKSVESVVRRHRLFSVHFTSRSTPRHTSPDFRAALMSRRTTKKRLDKSNRGCQSGRVP